MDVLINFSFLKFFNSIKNVGKALPDTQFDQTWLRTKAPKPTQDKFKKFYEWAKKEGIWHPKVKYPVMFGTGDSKYPGMLALEDIGPNEPIVKVPSRLIINTKVAYQCPDLQEIFYDNPEVFGKHTALGDDNVLDAYILYQILLGTKSKHYEMIQCWPAPGDTDILMGWTDEELEWLQDSTLAEDAQKGYEEFTMQWEQLYRCLKKYPKLFTEQSIGLNRFKYVYILTTNRCFSSNWPGVCQMVPFADYVNHENVDTLFDCVDENGISLDIRKYHDDSAMERWRQTSADTRDSVFNMKEELLAIEIELRRKMLEGGHVTQTQAEIDDQAMDLKLMSHVSSAFKAKAEAKKKKSEEQYEYSSGLSSDGDVDMLVEQETLRNKKSKSGPAPAETGSVDGLKGKEEIVLTKEEAKMVWEKTCKNVPEEYTFQIQTAKDVYPKGSQIYICYGRMSNREMLKRYGFCLTNNKYNNIFIKLRLELQDPDFKYRYYIMQKFFQIEIETKDNIVGVQSRHFKVYYQKLNTKMLKFVKIINFNVKKDDISTVLDTRSLSLEYISFQKLKGVYDEFLNNFPTSLQEDLDNMRNPQWSKNLSFRQHMAMVYRTEQKRILINQIKLVKIVMTIIERMMRGATLEFAVLRVHEFETAKDHVVNRLMLKSYLNSLERGLKANQEDYYRQKGLTSEDGEQLLKEVQKEMRADISKTAYKQFEIKGYERMISRVMEGSLQQNPALHDQFLSVQEALQKQKEVNEKLEIQMEEKIKQRQLQQAQLAIQDSSEAQDVDENSSYYDSEYESEAEDENQQLNQQQPQSEDKFSQAQKIWDERLMNMKQEWAQIQQIAKNENSATLTHTESDSLASLIKITARETDD